MADISKINLPNDANNPYDLKDSTLPHSSLSAGSGGTALSLVTTGEKYNWNRINNVLPGYRATIVMFEQYYFWDIDIDNKAGNVYVSSNEQLSLAIDDVQNIKTLIAVFGFCYSTVSNNLAIWTGIQSAYISNNRLYVNYVLYRHASNTIPKVKEAFLVIGTA